ncbi:(2Fe-2S)-binding protein [Candidatus Woesearchaeota archaeon]|nr:(2Fe-2S)-binding protein [Candidatus Woesearchaeota archaeon]
MATIELDKQTREIQDGGEIREACSELGVAFGCEEGFCGTCLVEVVDGAENLTPRTDKEEDMGLEGNQRLACQCRIKQGNVKLKY